MLSFLVRKLYIISSIEVPDELWTPSHLLLGIVFIIWKKCISLKLNSITFVDSKTLKYISTEDAISLLEIMNRESLPFYRL